MGKVIVVISILLTALVIWLHFYFKGVADDCVARGGEHASTYWTGVCNLDVEEKESPYVTKDDLEEFKQDIIEEIRNAFETNGVTK